MSTKQFSFDTIESFDDHILKSIPNYDILFGSIVRLSDYFLDKKKVVYDIGCSTGNLLRHFAKVENYNGKMVGIDYSRNLLPENTREFPNIQFMEYDLNQGFKFANACLVFSIFTMQFLKREARQKLINSIYEGLEPGGAFIIAEKVYHSDGQFQDMFTFSYYDYKKMSFTNEQILSKEKDLRTILKPNKAYENHVLLRNAGFEKIAMFYKFFHFEAYLCIK